MKWVDEVPFATGTAARCGSTHTLSTPGLKRALMFTCTSILGHSGRHAESGFDDNGTVWRFSWLNYGDSLK